MITKYSSVLNYHKCSGGSRWGSKGSLEPQPSLIPVFKYHMKIIWFGLSEIFMIYEIKSAKRTPTSINISTPFPEILDPLLQWHAIPIIAWRPKQETMTDSVDPGEMHYRLRVWCWARTQPSQFNFLWRDCDHPWSKWVNGQLFMKVCAWFGYFIC